MTGRVFRQCTPRALSSVTEVKSLQPVIDDYGRFATTFRNLGFQTAWLWACVTTYGGKRYALVREHSLSETTRLFTIEVSKDIWQPPTVRHAPVPGLDGYYWGRIDYEGEDEAWRIDSRNPSYGELHVSLSPERLRWSESNWLDLEMTPLGQALRYRCPGPPDDFGYTSQICRISGTVDGEPAEGFGGYDRAYHEPGFVWTQSKGHRFLEEYWWVWAGLDAKGRQEHGIVITGPHNFHVAFFHRDGEDPIATNQLRNEIFWEERNGRRLPAGATLEFAERRFRYRAAANVTPAGADLLFDWLHGEMVEQDRQSAVRCFSWCEYFKYLVKAS